MVDNSLNYIDSKSPISQRQVSQFLYFTSTKYHGMDFINPLSIEGKGKGEGDVFQWPQ